VARLSGLKPRIARLPLRIAAPPKVADQFYQSGEWRALVRRLKQERGAWCERCGSNRGLIADHVVEIKDGGAPLDGANVELLCATHHGEKTQRARVARVEGRTHGVTGGGR